MISFFRQIIILFLVAVFLLQASGKFIIYADYIINKKSITQKYCVNKLKPKMHCNGKCHMMKKMQEEDKKENSPVNNLKEKYEIQLFADFKTTPESINHFTIIKHQSIYSSSESTSHLLSVFHPPTC